MRRSSAASSWSPTFWLTPLYDPLLRWVMREEQFKRHLIRQAQFAPGQRVLDLGCGTTTLTILIKQIHPGAMVVGLDGDPKVLEISRAKARRARVEIVLDEGMDYHFRIPMRCSTGWCRV